MSIAEFYVEYGIDPGDSDEMDRFLESTRYESSGLCIGVVETNNDDTRLSEPALDQYARNYQYEKLDTSSSQAPMASYRKGAVRLNFWLTTGTVGSYLQHPRQGKTQLFRRDVKMDEAQSIFVNPRVHTKKGYHTKNKGPCRFGDRCYRTNCWFDH